MRIIGEYFLSIKAFAAVNSSADSTPSFMRLSKADTALQYPSSRFICSSVSSTGSSFETAGYITLVGAVFSALVSIGSESSAAVQTGECVDGFSNDFLRVFMPPFETAFTAAESACSVMWSVLYMSAALKATRLAVFRFLGFSSAVGFDRTFRYAKFGRNPFVS